MPRSAHIYLIRDAADKVVSAHTVIIGEVAHTAIEDARVVVKMLRRGANLLEGIQC